TPLLMLARQRARSACGRSRPSPTARLQRKSTGLNGFLPSAKADGFLHLNPQPRSALLLLRLFAPCSNVNCVSVWKEKLRPRLISKTESERFRERTEEQRQMAKSRGRRMTTI